MTALGKLLRTTAFKLTLVYLTVFALFAAFLLAYFAWNTRRLITEQITQTVDAEITGLAEQYRQGGIRRLVFVVDARSRRPGWPSYCCCNRRSIWCRPIFKWSRSPWSRPARLSKKWWRWA